MGCKLNQAESSAVEARLRALGLSRPPDVDPADVVVLNTCTVTGGADREARQIARRLRRANPRALLVATGCYAERDAAALRAAAGVDAVVGLQDQAGRIARLVADALGPRLPAPGSELGELGATAACDLRCSYCIIPSVRGASRSLPPDAIVSAIARLGEAGYREIVLTGVNTG